MNPTVTLAIILVLAVVLALAGCTVSREAIGSDA